MDKPATTNQKLISWVNEMAALCQPEKIFWCDGSDAENQMLCDLMVKSGTFIKLNAKSAPARIWRARIPATWHAWRTGRSFARRRRTRSGRQTIGPIPPR